MSAKTEACWDRTEGCCMTDAFERKMGRREGPQVIFFGGDDEREQWTWECRFPHKDYSVRTFNDAPTWVEAAAELTKHHARHHGARGRHGCPRCGAPVQNRVGDPERTDLCPPCTAEVVSGGLVTEATALRHKVFEHERRVVKVEGEIAGALNDAETRFNRIRALVTATGSDISCAGYGIGDDGCFVAGLAERVLAVLDGTAP